jgi:hypothetical protein
MKRRLLNLVTALSLLLCVVVGVLWVRSYWHFDLFNQCDLRWETLAWSGRSLSSANGGLWVMLQHGTVDPDEAADIVKARRQRQQDGEDPSAWHYSDYRATVVQGPSFLGFRWSRISYTQGATVMNNFSVGVPHAILAALAAVLPAAQLIRWRRDRTRGHRRACRQCGYDLRATPDRCPECGAAGPDADAPCPTALASTP